MTKKKNKVAVQAERDVRRQRDILLDEAALANPDIAAGRRKVNFVIAVTLCLRVMFPFFEMVYFLVAGIPYSPLPALITLLLLPVLFIIWNGARGFAVVPLISAFLRMVYLFLVIHPSLPLSPLANAYTCTALTVYALQFILSMILLFSSSCDAYFMASQRINVEVRGASLRGHSSGPRTGRR